MTSIFAIATVLLLSSPQPTNLGDRDCLARTICQVKEKVRWKSPAWEQTQCERLADVLIDVGHRYNLSPPFLLGKILNESGMNEKAKRVTKNPQGKVIAVDSGLMGVRCVVGRSGLCVNGVTRGLQPAKLFDMAVNVELGAKILQRLRDDGVSLLLTQKHRDASGHIHVVRVVKKCDHKHHPWYAHYNWGNQSFDKGKHSGYPIRVARMAAALAKVLKVAAPEVAELKSQHRDRLNKPSGKWQKKLYASIMECEGICTRIALVVGEDHDIR